MLLKVTAKPRTRSATPAMNASRSLASASLGTLKSAASPLAMTGFGAPISRMSGFSFAILTSPLAVRAACSIGGGNLGRRGVLWQSVARCEGMDEPRALEIRYFIESGGRLPMSYVRGVLQPGEHIRFETKIHWAIYVPGLLLVALAVAALIFGHTSVAIGALLIWQIIAAILFIAGAGFLLWAWFRRWITEIAVTDRRIIYKYGFIRRRTIEMHLDKV